MINLSNGASASANVSFPSIRGVASPHHCSTRQLPANTGLSRGFRPTVKSKARKQNLYSIRFCPSSRSSPRYFHRESLRSFPVATACQPRQTGQPMGGSLSLALFISLEVLGNGALPGLETGGKGKAGASSVPLELCHILHEIILLFSEIMYVYIFYFFLFSRID